MSYIKPTPGLIPRFNLDLKFSDLTHGVNSLVRGIKPDLSFVKSIFGETIFFTNSGRVSLYILLKSLKLPKGAKVGVPLYSCTVVFDAILKAGLKPCFIDIDIDNYTLDPKDLEEKISDLDVIIVIHTFGRPADMDLIKNVADGLYIIEGCAHSLFSKYKGEITGKLGDASFFSFAKYISAGEGGMIVINNGGGEGVEKEITSLESKFYLNELKDALFEYIKSCLYHRPWFGLFAYSLGSNLESRVDIMNKRTFKISKINRISLYIFLRKIKIFKELVERQRMNSFLLTQELKDTHLILPHEKEETYWNYYLFPVRFDNKNERDRAWKSLRKMNVDTARLYSMTPAVARKFYGYRGDCQNSENLSDTVLIIPNYYSLSKDDLMTIAKSVRKVCS